MTFLGNLFGSFATSVWAVVCFAIAFASACQVCRAIKYARIAFNEHRTGFALGKLLRVIMFSYIMKLTMPNVVKFPILGWPAAILLSVAFACALLKVFMAKVETP